MIARGHGTKEPKLYGCRIVLHCLIVVARCAAGLLVPPRDLRWLCALRLMLTKHAFKKGR